VFFSKKLYRLFKKNSTNENLPEEFFAFASPRGVGEDFWGDGHGESLSYAFEKITCVAEWLIGNEAERYATNDLVVAFLHF